MLGGEGEVLKPIEREQIIAGQFRIIDKLGEGGMGDIFLAEQLNMSRRVVIKFMQQSLVEHEDAIERFKREARSLAQLQHPNVVMVYAFGAVEESGLLYLAMEYIHGLTLRERIGEDEDGHPLPVDAVFHITDQVLSALVEAHAQGIVHRDLKPSNIMVTQTADGVDRVKVLDFGVAKLLDDASLTKSGAILGTPRYISPEQVNNVPIDGRSDLYALGVIMYEMLAGVHPIDAKTPVQFLLGHASQDVIMPSRRRPELGIATELDMVVAHALKKDPNERYASARAMQEALRQAFNKVNGGRVLSGSNAPLPLGSVRGDQVSPATPPMAAEDLETQDTVPTTAAVPASAVTMEQHGPMVDFDVTLDGQQGLDAFGETIDPGQPLPSPPDVREEVLQPQSTAEGASPAGGFNRERMIWVGVTAVLVLLVLVLLLRG